MWPEVKKCDFAGFNRGLIIAFRSPTRQQVLTLVQ